MLHLHHANRLEDLAEKLRRNLETPLGEVLKPEIIVVPGTAISEWVESHWCIWLFCSLRSASRRWRADSRRARACRSGADSSCGSLRALK